MISLKRAVSINEHHLQLQQVIHLSSNDGDDEKQYTGSTKIGLQMYAKQKHCMYRCMVIAFPRDGNSSGIFDFTYDGMDAAPVAQLKNVKELVVLQIPIID